MGKYSLVPVKSFADWNELVEKSPQGTIFSRSDFLEAAAACYSLQFVFKGNEIKAGLALCLSNDGCAVVLDDLVIYNGLLFCDDPTQKTVKQRSEQFQIAEMIIEELDRKYRRIELALAPQFQDVRPFLWHNYHSGNPGEKFEVDVRYTSYLDISPLDGAQPAKEDALFAQLEVIRQRNLREAYKSGAYLTTETDTSVFIRFYKGLMIEQGKAVDAEKLARMQSLVDFLLQSGKGEMVFCRNHQGDPLYAVVFCWDQKRAYYLFGAGTPESQTRYQGTFAFWEGFRLLAREHGIKEVDLEGTNSPQRGWFKLSFGGDLRTYFQVNKPSRTAVGV